MGNQPQKPEIQEIRKTFDHVSISVSKGGGDTVSQAFFKRMYQKIKLFSYLTKT